MSLIKRDVIGPDEIKLKFYSTNNEFRILFYHNGVWDREETQYYNDREEAEKEYNRYKAAIFMRHCALPDCFSLPLIEHEIFRPDLKDEFWIRFTKTDNHGNVISHHEVRFYHTIESHSMTVLLNVDFDGLRWHQERVTEHNRAAAIEFWQMLGDREFRGRDRRIQNMRSEAEEYFKTLNR